MKGRLLRVFICIALSLLFVAVSVSWGVGVVFGEELPLIEQQKIARNLFRQIAAKDQWDLDGIEPLFLEVIEKAPGVPRAEEAYWMLSNMYMQAYDPPRYKDTVALLEQYLDRYPDSRTLDKKFPMFSSPGLPLVKGRLLFLYEQEEMWDKAAALYGEIIPDPMTVNESLIDHLVGYGVAMERTGRTVEAIAAYTAYLERSGNSGSFLEEVAKASLKELGVEIPSVSPEGAESTESTILMPEIPLDPQDTAESVLDDPLNLESFRGRNDEIFHFRVHGTATGPVWGDGIYTDDSLLSVAAVHAGLLRPGDQAVVSVRILPGRENYEGTEKNGVVSESYGRWQGSFEFVETPAHLREMIPLVQEEEGGIPSNPGNLENYRGRNGEVFRFRVRGATIGNVWGDGIYTDDSSLSAAAVHAGLLRPGEEGVIGVRILPGRARYEGAERNGVVSESYADWYGSFEFVEVPQD